MTHQVGDKVLIKKGKHTGKRAVIAHFAGSQCLLSILDSDQQVEVNSADILNYSLAARRAWLKMPTRNVGRPAGTRVSDRVSVTFRIDRQLWNDFQDAEEQGFIENRTATINTLLQNFVDRVHRTRRKAS